MPAALVYNRNGLEPKTSAEFEKLSAGINGYLGLEHGDDGTHTDIVPDTISLQGAQVGVWTDLPTTGGRFYTSDTAVWTVEPTDINYLKAMRIGELVLVTFSLEHSEITVSATGGGLYLAMPEFSAIPFSSTGRPFQCYLGGMLEWNDIQHSDVGVGTVTAIAQPPLVANGPSYTVLKLGRLGTNSRYEDWPVSNNISVTGTVWFPVMPNNQPITYSFLP